MRKSLQRSHLLIPTCNSKARICPNLFILDILGPPSEYHHRSYPPYSRTRRGIGSHRFMPDEEGLACTQLALYLNPNGNCNEVYDKIIPELESRQY